jgi:GT2 family glycosyltransferase
MNMDTQLNVDVSIVIVAFRAKESLRTTLASVFASNTAYSYEVFVVDNDSGDGSADMVEFEFPAVKLIRNPNNGFSGGNNVAIRLASGRLVLVLNPDTELSTDVLDKCSRYLDDHPDIGALGCKVVKPDGRLEKGARRSFPNPLTSFYRLSGLALLFPNSRKLAAYNLTFLPDDQETDVDAISGSFMFIPKRVFDKIGLFDEAFFMYGEDLDLCFRIKSAGYRVHYYPAVTTIHYGGQSSKTVPRIALWHFHNAMWIFFKKHYANKHGHIFRWFIFACIRLRWSLLFLFKSFKANNGRRYDLRVSALHDSPCASVLSKTDE